MPQTAETNQPQTPWLDLLRSPASGDATSDLGARITRLAERAAAHHLMTSQAEDRRLDVPQNNLPHDWLYNPSPAGRHGRQPLALDIPASRPLPGSDHGTAAKECG
ncbi:MAG: hypothetical protein AAGI68_13685 [Planctomycetota bacterium]